MPRRGSILAFRSNKTTSSRSNDPSSMPNSQASISHQPFIMSCMIAIILLGKIIGGGMIINRTRVFAFKIYFKLKKVSLNITQILLGEIMLMGVIMIGGARMLGEMRVSRKIEENNMSR